MKPNRLDMWVDMDTDEVPKPFPSRRMMPVSKAEHDVKSQLKQNNLPKESFKPSKTAETVASVSFDDFAKKRTKEPDLSEVAPWTSLENCNPLDYKGPLLSPADKGDSMSRRKDKSNLLSIFGLRSKATASTTFAKLPSSTQ